MVTDFQTREIRAKFVLIGIPHCGKRQILQDWATRQGKRELFHERVSETSVYRAPFRWEGIPRPEWSIHLQAFTTDGDVSYSAVNEMLLDDVDGVVFVAPIDSSRAGLIKDSLFQLGEVMSRHQRSLGEIPVVMHYHQVERMPGFDPVSLNQFLGVPEGSIPHVVTRSDDGSALTSSLAILFQEIVSLAEEELAHEESVVTVPN